MMRIGTMNAPDAPCFNGLGVLLEHKSLLVFRHFGRFRTINPMLKVRMLICDGGRILGDSVFT